MRRGQKGKAMSQSYEGRAMRQFALSKGRRTSGRNSSGRITIFHRGGGAKRLHRSIDLKRNNLSMGIVERIEYDPNRSSRIALVRWTEGVQLPSQRKCKTTEELAPLCKIVEPSTTLTRGIFSLSHLPGKLDHGKVACFSSRPMAASVVVGLPTGTPPWSKSPFANKDAGSKKTCVKDVFSSFLSSPKTQGEAASLSCGRTFSIPRIAVAGAKPAFFAPQMREKAAGKNSFTVCEVPKMRTQSILWAHKVIRKAAFL